MTLADLVLVLGLVAANVRVTRLLILDEIPLVKVPRDWILRTFWVHDQTPEETMRRFFGHGWRTDSDDDNAWLRFWVRVARGASHSFAYLWTCPWCMSVWVGLVLWPLADWRLSVPYPWLVIAAGSLASGIYGEYYGEHEQRYKLRERQLRDLDEGEDDG